MGWKRSVWLVIFLFAVACLTEAEARVVEWIDGLEIPVHLSTVRTTHVKLFCYPDKVLTTVREYLNVSYYGKNVFLKATRPLTDGDYYVVCDTGEVIHFVLSTGSSYDEIVRVYRAMDNAKQAFERRANRAEMLEEEITPLRFLKGILWGPLPPGTSEEAVSPPRLIFSNGIVEMVLYRIYRTPAYTAYVVKERNVSGTRVYVPVSRLWFPGLILIRSSKDFLNPGESDTLIFVARTRNY